MSTTGPKNGALALPLVSSAGLLNVARAPRSIWRKSGSRVSSRKVGAFVMNISRISGGELTLPGVRPKRDRLDEQSGGIFVIAALKQFNHGVHPSLHRFQRRLELRPRQQ
jgi:hypothetical protein